jgi:hypothetical protein
MNRRILTSIIVLGLSFVVGGFFVLNLDPGIEAEVVAGPAGPVTGTSASVTLCVPAGATLAQGISTPERVVIEINQATELIDQRKRSPARFQPEDLQPGSRVRLWSSGTMAISEPAQLTATRMNLLSDPSPDRPSICSQ